MNTETTEDHATDPTDRILAMVDLATAATLHPELTLAEKTRIEEVTRKAYFLARAAGASHREAAEKGLEAARGSVAEFVASPLVTAELAPSGTPSAGSPLAKNGSDPSMPFSEFDHELRLALLGPELTKEIEGEASKTNLETHAESEAQGVDAVGLARSERDLEAARAAGFAPAETVWTRGLRVITAGVEAAHRSRLEYEEKPLVIDMCGDLQTTIASEHRFDVVARGSSTRMSGRDGRLLVTDVGDRSQHELVLSRDAFGGMCSRMGYGGAQYLTDKCSIHLRCTNVLFQHEKTAIAEQKAMNDWLASGAGEKDAPAPRILVFRTRHEDRTYATVTPGYAAFDGDKVAAAINDASPPGARGTVTYDGTRTRFEVLFQSTVQPKHFVAGEFFRAGVIVRSDDTGGGAIRGSSVVWQNRCLNLAIIDRQARELFSLRHTGSVYELARKFRAEFNKSLCSIEHFIHAWDYACEDNVVETARLISDDTVPANTPQAVRGLFAGLLVGGSRARIRLPGRKIAEHVEELCKQWEADSSSAVQVHAVSRAAIVNAFTSYAHTVQMDDPFAEDEIQRQACALLWGTSGKAPRPMEYVDLNRASDAAEQAGAS